MTVHYLEKIVSPKKNKTRNRETIYKNVTMQKRIQQMPITS